MRLIDVDKLWDIYPPQIPVSLFDLGDAVDKLEVTDVVPARNGQWLPPDDNYRAVAFRKCSDCGKNVYMAQWMNYCPECGSKNIHGGI